MNNSGFTPKSPFSNQEPFLLKSQDNGNYKKNK